MSKTLVNIAVFASGEGSNALRLARHFEESSIARVRLIVTNNPKAGVVEGALQNALPVFVLGPVDLIDGTTTASMLKKDGIDVIVLAGYLKLVPAPLISAFAGRIVNLHPALLPKHGGQGMYGSNVHRAVQKCGDIKSGITLHHVSDEYDRGEIIAQFETELKPTETAIDIERKVRLLEEKHLASAIEKWIETLL